MKEKNKLNKHLYQFCDPWFHGGSVYFYSDPHFSDDEMKYLRKNYCGDEEQINRINNRVHTADTLVILGDVGNIECVNKLKAGYKILIKGNHDSGNSNYECLFDEIYDGPLTVSDKIILSHEPLNTKYHLNIHGHDHSNRNTDLLGKHINCCAEFIDYTPINLNSIIKSGVLKEIDNIHRATIDNATEKRNDKQTLIVMCGIPGSGKSHFSKEYSNSHPDFEIVSTDEIRKQLFNDETNQENNYLVFLTAYQQIEKILKKGKSVIFDATNLKSKDRKKITKYFSEKNLILKLIVMKTFLDVCKLRQKQRERSVPEDVIEKMYNSFEEPDKSEGWNEILYNSIKIN